MTNVQFTIEKAKSKGHGDAIPPNPLKSKYTKMKTILKMKNRIQTYAWGSHTVIAELLGTGCPSDEPQAELWMGAHSKAPSQVHFQGRWVDLPEVIRMHPKQILGKGPAERYQNRLPYLFKVLAAAQPLSIQAHPNKTQALAGFARENHLAIALDAPNRNYKDENHKPEILCALTDFWAVCGFRPIAEMLALLDLLGLDELKAWLEGLRKRPQADQLKYFFKSLMTLTSKHKATVIQTAVEKARRQGDRQPEFQWLLTLQRRYPQDIGILAPVLLNLICLEPGQAIFLDAGVAHAYLQGAGIELMANSDNVLRGGLTSKHIDVEELLKILTFQPAKAQLIEPVVKPGGQRIYPCRAEEFELARIRVQGTSSFESSESRGVEILFCSQGEATVVENENLGCFSLTQGQSILVPACHPGYRLEGPATLFKASGPRL
jgi:mannose-6-phosphate isomerase